MTESTFLQRIRATSQLMSHPTPWPKGKLPVSVGNGLHVGDGISINSISRLGYTVPERVGIDSKKLHKIDAVAQRAVDDHMTPGIQLLVARKGKVIYNQNFGKHTYEKDSEPVKFNDVYDIASITKIAATLPILMQKVDARTFDLDKPFINYLSVDDTCSKAKITSREVLAHQAQLWPWIPFYKETVSDTGLPDPMLYSKVKSNSFQVEVAADLFMKNEYLDTVLNKVIYSKMREEKEYKYSDIGYYMLSI